MQSLLHTYKRYRTLQTHTVSALPLVILMPHSACNCRCAMCDIWKGNKNLQQLKEEDIRGLLSSLKYFGTRQVVMSGGEALLNPAFFTFCKMLRQQNIQIVLLTTGLTIVQHAEQLVQWVNEIIVSLDGDEPLHNDIRNIPGAFGKLKEGINKIRSLKPGYKISGRTVIHALNYKAWPRIVKTSKELGLDSISFLPADVSSQAFNRKTPWDAERQQEIAIEKEELPQLKKVIEQLIQTYATEFSEGYIRESPEKIWKLYWYYSALNGLNPFPYKKCNAPWVSAVIEADGSVLPCFFHPSIGNIRTEKLRDIINSRVARDFRKNLDMRINTTCSKCVCSLYLKPSFNPASMNAL